MLGRKILQTISNLKIAYLEQDRGYEITFDSAGSWSFDNGTARIAITFGVHNSSSSHTDNHKNNFLILGEGPTFGINGSFGSP